MTVERREIAAHRHHPGLTAMLLTGGPWNGREVWVSDSQARLVVVHGPRHGNHRIWISHVYQRRGECYEFVNTEIQTITASF